MFYRLRSDVLIWRDSETGETVQVNSDHDGGFAKATRTEFSPIHDIATTIRFTPNFIKVPFKAVGRDAADRRNAIIESGDYEAVHDAVNPDAARDAAYALAINYMKQHGGVKNNFRQ